MGKIADFSALSIIRGLGGDPNSGMCRCPAHDDRKASLHVEGKNGRVLVKCHAGCSQETVIASLRTRGLWPSGERPAPTSTRPDQSSAVEDYERFRTAFAILRAAALAGAGKPAAYLNGRGIDVIPKAAMLLPASEARRVAGRGFPAMVLPVIGAKGLCGAHLTFLSRDEMGKLPADNAKQLRGPVKGGYAVLGVADSTKPLIVAEGIETALSAAQITELPAIAALSAGNMAEIDPPQCSEVIIAADNDEAGRKAAEGLARKLSGRGLVVRVAMPERDSDDWNDALCDRGANLKALRRAILGAEKYEPQRGSANDQDARPLTTRSINQFEPRDIEWQWHPFIPLAMITTFYGDGGVGKSTVLLDVAARVTRGSLWPSFGGEKAVRAQKGSVLILCKEDDVSRIIRPRLEAAEADISRVHTLGYEVPDDSEAFDPIERLDTTAKELERQVAKIGDVRMVIIDPITDYVGKIDMYRDDQVRSLLNPLGRIAAQYNLAIVNVLHLNKKADIAARYRGMGSIAFRNVSRSAVLVANSVEMPGRKVMMLEKWNLTDETRAAAFHMRTVGAHPRVEWEPEWQTIDADEALSAKGATKQQLAAGLLRDWLADGFVPATEIQKLAQANGISRGTLRLAKDVVGIVSEKHSDGKWSWRLP